MERAVNSDLSDYSLRQIWSGEVVVRTVSQSEVPPIAGLKEQLVMKALSDAVKSQVYSEEAGQARLDELYPDQGLNLSRYESGIQ